MSSAPASHPPANQAPQPPALPEDAQFYRAVLHELIDIGVGLARDIQRQAAPTPGAPNNPDAAERLVLAFDRVARAVRRTIALAAKLAEPPAAAARATLAPPALERTNARKRIIRKVEDAIHREAAGPGAETLAANLAASLAERLDAPDLDDDIATRPLPEIIAEICRDLGLGVMPFTHPPKRRTAADIADLYARAAAPAPPPRITLVKRE